MKLSFTSLIATTLAASAIATDPSRQLNLHAPNRQQTEAPVEHFEAFHQPPSLHAHLQPPQGASYLHQANRQQASALAASAMAGDPSRRLPIPHLQAEAPSPHLEHFKTFHEPLRAHRDQGGPLQLQAPTPQRASYQEANLWPAETCEPHTTSYLHHEANRQPVWTPQYDPPYPQARQTVGRFEAERLPAPHQAQHDLHHEANRQPVRTHQYPQARQPVRHFEAEHLPTPHQAEHPGANLPEPAETRQHHPPHASPLHRQPVGVPQYYPPHSQARQPVGRFEAGHFPAPRRAEDLHLNPLEAIGTAIETTSQAIVIVPDIRTKKSQQKRKDWLLERQRVHSSEEGRRMTRGAISADVLMALHHTSDAQIIINRHQGRK